MILHIDQVRREASALLDSKRRAELGQYMTPSSIAEFMASLFTYNGQAKLLDAGAGVGSLTVAFIEKAQLEGTTVVAEVWEIDPLLGNFLRTTLADSMALGSGNISAHLHDSDFIEDATSSIQFDSANRYTHAILNPPYKKITSHSKHRKLLRAVGIETVNLYTAFVALSILMMREGGEIVAIIPRSFCNGSYYRPFRQLLLRHCTIQQLHLFESRSQAFQDDDVLQENLILHLIKGGKQGAVTVSTSLDAQFADYQQASFDIQDIVQTNDAEQFIRIPTTLTHTRPPALCTHTLQELGLAVCTGPVVDFRLKDHWCEANSDDAIPLLYPHHFSQGEFSWPKAHKKPNALCHSTEIEKWLMPRGHYVLVKRFSAKEERRRLVAYHLSADELKTSHIGFENHWNIFHIDKHGLSEEVAKGLSIFLNSTQLDEHFRVFSGHTQVNATDLRNMRYPSLEQLCEIARRANGLAQTQTSIDRLIEELEIA
ncbi:Eco57I restriction-modification methylase domain-containing protein [Ferrigenium sp. UT4]